MAFQPDGPRGRSNKGGENDGVYAEFFLDAVPLKAESEKQGRPISVDREFVRIITADTRTERVTEVLEKHKVRFEEAYRAFKQASQQRMDAGTPLNQWPAMTPALIRNFAAFGIFTMEQLAGLDGRQALQMAGMDAPEWSAKARAYLEQAQDASTSTRLAAENARLKGENEDLKAQIRRLSETAANARRLAREELEAGDDDDMPMRRGPGRPRKNPDIAA